MDQLVTDPRRTYWDDVYTHTRPDAVSWHESQPRTSMGLLDSIDASPGDAILDAGGGASPLARHLTDRGFLDVTVVDVSPVSLEVCEHELEPSTDTVDLLAEDLTHWSPGRRYDVWHDRAAFHFLTDPAERDAYLAALHSCLAHDGAVVLATFAPHGPTTCSGLPVVRYTAEDLSTLLGADYTLVRSVVRTHTTPSGHEQPFTWAAFRRNH